MPSQGYHAEHRALKAVASQLHEWTGIEPEVQQGRGRASTDGEIRLGDLSLPIEVKARGNAATVVGAVEQIARAGHRAPVVLVVPYMSREGRDRCADAGVSWIDLSGNARLQASTGRTHLTVWVEGRPNAFAKTGRPPNAFAPKAARATRALLLATEPLRQTEIAERAGLGPGYTSKVVRRLEDLDLVERFEDNAVAPVSRAVLLDAWAGENAYRHEVVAGHVSGRSGEERARRLAEALDKRGVPHAFTGLAAAWAYTHAASFRSVSCYVTRDHPSDPVAVASDIGFRTDTEAPNVRLLIPDDDGVFEGARVVNGLRCVAPAQVYVDLAREPERADEFAEAVRPLALHP